MRKNDDDSTLSNDDARLVENFNGFLEDKITKIRIETNTASSADFATHRIYVQFISTGIHPGC